MQNIYDICWWFLSLFMYVKCIVLCLEIFDFVALFRELFFFYVLHVFLFCLGLSICLFFVLCFCFRCNPFVPLVILLKSNSRSWMSVMVCFFYSKFLLSPFVHFLQFFSFSSLVWSLSVFSENCCLVFRYLIFTVFHVFWNAEIFSIWFPWLLNYGGY